MSDKSHRGNASQFFISGELCRRGYAAVVTLGNTPNVDILVSNKDGTRFAHVQVKTFAPEGKGKITCSVGMKATKEFGPSFFWVLGGIPAPGSDKPFIYYVIPADVMAKNVNEDHELWLRTPGVNGRPHQESTIRTVHIPPHTNAAGWSIAEYENRWELITDHLNQPPDEKDKSPATD